MRVTKRAGEFRAKVDKIRFLFQQNTFYCFSLRNSIYMVTNRSCCTLNIY